MPFTSSTAASFGVGKARLRRDDLERPFFGVRALERAESAHDLARAFRCVMADDQFFSHQTAAALWGLPLPRRLHQLAIHVTTLSDDRSARGAGVVGHRTRRRRGICQKNGFRLSDPHRTWLDLAGKLDLDELVVLGDAIVRPRYRAVDPEPIGNLESLVDEVRSARNIAGLRRARDATSLVRVGSGSPSETLLRLAILRHGLPEPELNGKVYSQSGSYLGRPDFVFRAERVVVEYEGDHHRVDPATWRQDIARRERCEDNDWRMVRATGDDLGRSNAAFLSRLARLLVDRAPLPT